VSDLDFSNTPYKGLVPYTEEDALYFFGRETEREIITANLLASRLTLLYGASGVGKSSVLRAGVVHYLRGIAAQDLAARGNPEFAVVFFNSWRDDPVSGLIERIRESVAQALSIPTLDSLSSGRSFLETLQLLSDRVGGDLLIILDQFEEYFLYHEQEDREGSFAVEFPRTVNRPELRVNFLLSIREDALAKVDHFKWRVPGLFKNYLRVDHLDREAARLAITEPIGRFNEVQKFNAQPVTIEDELVEVMLDQVQVGENVLGQGGRGTVQTLRIPSPGLSRIEMPYLQIVLSRLWDEEVRAGSSVLRRATLDRLQGAKQIVRTHLDQVMQKLDENERNITSQLFHYLVTPSGTKIAHSLADLALYAKLPPERVQPVLATLAAPGVRVLRAFVASGNQPERYEIFHDVLAPAIVDWRTRHVQKLERLEAEKRAAEEAEKSAQYIARQRRRQQLLAGTLGLFAILTVGAGAAALFGLRQKEQAEKQAKLAVEANNRATEQLRLARAAEDKARAAEDKARAAEQKTREVAGQANVDLARYSLEVGTDARALAQLAQALRLDQRNYEATALIGAILTQTNWPLPAVGLMRHDSVINSAQFSPDGQRFVTASADKTARLWDAVTGKAIGEPMKHEGIVYSAQLSPDGRRVVTASEDKTARLWDTVTGKAIGEPMEHEGKVYSAQFSPDGRRVVTASADKTARLWDAVTGKAIGEPMKHGGAVLSAQFGPDGQRVVTGSDDKTARLWDSLTGKAIGEPMKHEDVVLSAQFSPDGQRVVTGSDDKTARLWDSLTGKPIGEPMKHEGAVLSAQFSPDSQRVVTGSDDKTARLWDSLTGKPIGEPMEHEGAVLSAEFSPDAQRVVTASGDWSARLWDALTGKLMGEPMKHEYTVNSAQFSPDGQRVVTASADKTARLWNILPGKTLSESMKHEGSVLSTQFSPDGQRLVTASTDKTAQLWDALTEKPMGEVMKHEGRVYSAQFSPDGRRIVTASADKTARLWNGASGRALGEPMKHEAGVYSAEFSPDGQRVVTASWDGSARLWDGGSGQALGEPMKHEAGVYSAQFSPNGQRVVTASADKTARLWDSQTGAAIGEPMKHGGAVLSAQFSPNSQRVVTGSDDNTARLWDAQTGRAIGEPMKHEGRVYFAQFSPDGKQVVTASWDGTARLWDGASGQALGEPMKHTAGVYLAEFSSDGERVVTASEDGTARLWDALTGKPIGDPMRHEGSVNTARFSLNGQRVATASDDKTARLWDVPATRRTDTEADATLLADLAEATGGVVLQTLGQVEVWNVLTPQQISAAYEKIAAKFTGPTSILTPLQRFLKWSVLERRNRTISPFSEVTIAEWVENRIAEGTLDGLRAAMKVNPTNALLAARFGRRLAVYSLAKETDPDEARRARGEANFQTGRALKLAPDDGDVKELRAEVVNLLHLISE
jgi:WD40 repeat protein